MNRYGKPRRKLTIWLGSDNEGQDGMNGYGYEVTREDSMVLVQCPVPQEDDEELEVFILPDLFPKIRAAMDAAEGRPARDPLAGTMFAARKPGMQRLVITVTCPEGTASPVLDEILELIEDLPEDSGVTTMITDD